MKNFVSLILVLAFACSSFAQDDKPLFDMAAMDNCTICKCMSDVKSEMMKFKWETHVIDNGLLTVTVVPDDMKEKWGKCKKSMDETIAELSGDEDLCHFCQSFGELIKAGAKKSELETAGGQLMLITSDKPELVAKIQKFGKKMMSEQKKMKEKMKEKMMEEQKG